MKRHIRYLAFGIATVTLFITEFCLGQSENETVYYNNPDIISNRPQREQVVEQESGAELYKNTKLVFATVEDAQKFLTTKDKYINSQTPYDRKLRLNKEESVSVKEYLDFLSEQALDWTESEKTQISVLVQNISHRLEKYDLNLPSEIFLVKTTGKEEGEAAYCRGNAIVLPQNIVRRIGQSTETLIVHELFHIFTKNNLDMREKLYKVINFKKCGKVELPQELLDIEVTNPDVPSDRYYVELQHEGENIDVIPMITVPNFNPGINRPFFYSLKFQLVGVEKIDSQYKYKRNESGEPVVYEQNQLPDYLKKVGENTNYLIHPEEILADNFAIMVLEKQPVKSQWVIDKMKSLLENKNKNVVGIDLK
ncbi:MAG: hypothetical protein JXA96_08010 [Sedimentisphaerales bacterium]|nr:hypothetical protein [Sedimentisphaerales bacterium]